MYNIDFINKRYFPTKTDLIAEFYIEPNRISIEKAANYVAGESSIGTWTDVVSMKPEIKERLQPTVFSIKNNRIKIAYPLELFEPGNIPQILSSIGGNVFGMKALKNLRLEDITFPKKIVDSFQGPRLGINGVRKLLRVKHRPLVGTIVKPKVGQTAKEHSSYAYNAWSGGLDLVKDDENLTSMTFNKFKDRITYTLDMQSKAEWKTGESKIYLPNVTAAADVMLERADYVREQGGKYIMVDIVTSGWSALQLLRKEAKLVIHAHRAGHAMFTNNPKHGMSMITVAKIARLIGVDNIHVGAIVGKMIGSAKEVEHIGEEIESHLVKGNDRAHMLEQNWYHIKPTFPVCSGGLHPGLVRKLVSYMGNNIIIQMGGGVSGHPDGIIAGAQAARQAVDATMKNIPLNKYAENHPELQKAIKTWGYI